MKKEKNVIGIVALIVAILGLSIGFAAFTATLNITTTTATYTPPTSDWNVACSSATVTADGDATCGKGTISGSTWSGLTATLVRPGDSCTWTCTMKNSGKYTAYLNSVSGGAKTCTPAATSDLATNACADITFAKTPGSPGGSISAGGSQTIMLELQYAAEGGYTDEQLNIAISDVTFKYESRD